LKFARLDRAKVGRHFPDVSRKGLAMAAATYSSGFVSGEAEAKLRRIRRLAWLVDAAFVIPGTKFRFGLNSLIGLAPGAGDAVLGVLSLYIIYEAAQLGVPRALLLRMIGNVVIEVVGGSIPLIGDLFDVALKANIRNIRVLERHLRATGQMFS
jgi:hypothetical protein